MRSWRNAFSLVLLLILAGCAQVLVKHSPPLIKVTVNSVSALGVDLAALHTFAFAPSGTDEPLVEQNLQSLLAARLKAQGLNQDPQNPDMVIVVSHEVSKAETWIEAKKEKKDYYEPATTKLVTHYNRQGGSWTEIRNKDGRWKTSVKEIPGRMEDDFLKKIHLAFFKLKTGLPEEEGKGLPLDTVPLWEGNVFQQGKTSDLLKVAPVMLRELAAEFPLKSGRPETREVPQR
jgi:hypothetical protein